MLYIIGPSGSGKTTTLTHLLAGIPATDILQPIAHTVYTTGAIQLGKRRGTFSGTDALSLGVQPKAIDFLRTIRPTALIAEGDRLANDAFFHEAMRQEYDLHIILLDVDKQESARRRAQREHPMSASFVKGRETKAHNLANLWDHATRIIDARQGVEDVVAALRDEPAIRAARGER